ncbi:MAG: hypothetical protein H7Y42_01000, partial [Chitinophagaceae bacterium]|nr:hypothetical protein [Chitinophagaceae bacterium]
GCWCSLTSLSLKNETIAGKHQQRRQLGYWMLDTSNLSTFVKFLLSVSSTQHPNFYAAAGVSIQYRASSIQHPVASLRSQ